MRGVIYARYSSDRQSEQSIEGQLRECQQYAEDNNIRIVGTYIDRAKTGRNDNRADFQKMLRDSKSGIFDCVIVWKIDRFGRNREDIAKNKAILRRNGVSVLYAKEHIPDGAEGIILEGLLESLAEYYSAELREKVVRGMRESAYKCRFNGAGLALGFCTDEERVYHIEENEAKIVRLAFDSVDGGMTVADVKRMFDERGIVTRRGKSFTHTSITRILRDRQYLGEYRWGDIVIPGGIPRIISDEQFERVGRALDANKKVRSRTETEGVVFLLTGKVFCGHCHGTVIGDSGTSKTGKLIRYYSCRAKKSKHTCNKKSVGKEWLEREVTRLTAEVVLQDDVIEYIAQRVVAIQQSEFADSSVVEYLKAKLAETDAAIRNIVRAIEAGVFSETTGERLRELEAERDTLRIDIERENVKRPTLVKEQVIYFLSKFKGGDINDKEYQRQIIEMFVDKVFIYDDRIIITYNHSGEHNEVTAEIVEEAASEAVSECSDKLSLSPPDEYRSNTIIFFMMGGVFGIMQKIKDRV